MDRSADPEIWGTLEELLLAFAISRHGSQSWESVAMEVRSRSPAAVATADSCRRRYLDLRRRFADSDDASTAGDGEDDLPPGASIPWLEDLRRLRVAELRRELHRYDVSILSLQSKVKRLKDEHERSVREDDGGEVGPDPKDEEEDKDAGSPRSKPKDGPRDRISGSSYESNSTDPGGDPKPMKEIGDQAGEGGGGPYPDLTRGKPTEEASYNGSSDTMARAIAESNPARLGESVAESKGRKEEEEEVSKETSDVQSSASLSRRRRRRWRLRKAASGSSSSSGGADEPEAEAEPQSLVGFLDVIRSDEYGIVFDRRLDSQESAEYKSLIRRHVDLEMVRSKLEGRRGRADGAYTRAEFFRDLLLLCTNAIVFYPKDSHESIAAAHLRELVRKEMDKSIMNRPRRPRPPSPPEMAAEVEHFPPPPPPVPVPAKLKSEPARASSPLEKPSTLGPLVTCKKRSSISAKAAAAVAAAAAEAAKEEKAKEEKPNPIQKEEQSPLRKRTKERPTLSGPRGLRSNKARAKNPNPPAPPTQKPTTQAETSSEKKTDSTAKKQRNAAPSPSTPSRVKRTWPSSKAPLLESLKKETASGGRAAAETKKGGRAAEGKKDSAGRQGSGSSKKLAEQTPPARRSVGRPPKKTAAPPPPSKRAREEAPPPAKRKRGKK
ncbi:uncharacterized protein [Typha angustifolia]|uniref:uncharacterized protein n=1 Tax=Typha angustifolia TaxID=59011 RepID=UPI003C2FF4B1